MSARTTIAKSVALLILIAAISAAGLFWFDFLGLIRVRNLFAPIYKALGFAPQTSQTASEFIPVEADLESDRLAKRLEALEIEKQALEKRDSDLSQKEKEFAQIAQELEDRKSSQEEREAAFQKALSRYEDREENIAQNARNLTGMVPQNAVNILNAMDEEEAVDVLRKTEQIAQEEGSASMVAYWLSLMPPERAAVLQRKMANAVGAGDEKEKE